MERGARDVDRADGLGLGLGFGSEFGSGVWARVRIRVRVSCSGSGSGSARFGPVSKRRSAFARLDLPRGYDLREQVVETRTPYPDLSLRQQASLELLSGSSRVLSRIGLRWLGRCRAVSWQACSTQRRVELLIRVRPRLKVTARVR
eukprot:scaffold136880_cov139-Phaeocystis_antarctica.AAC.1